MSKPTEFGFGTEVWRTLLLVIEVKYLSSFFRLATILWVANLQFLSRPALAKPQISRPVAGLAKLQPAKSAA